jgi:hypothetical protein
MVFTMKMTTMQNRALKDLTDYVWRRHMGCLIEKVKDGYMTLGVVYPTHEDACYGIEKSRKEFIETIKKQNPKK